MSSAYPSSLAEQLSSDLLPSIAVFLYIAAVFFLIGLELGRRQQKQDDRIAVWQRQVQTLERIWRSTADHKD